MDRPWHALGVVMPGFVAMSLVLANDAPARLHLGTLDTAFGNLLGGNLFNVMIMAVDDRSCRRGPLLGDAAPVHAGTAVAACPINITLLALA